jgi:hypothetical protein
MTESLLGLRSTFFATAFKQADSALLVLEWEPLEWEPELLDAVPASEQIPLFRPGPV